MALRAIRGATHLRADDPNEMDEAVAELLLEISKRNDVTESQFISILFTATNDIRCGFPAKSLRKIGFAEVPLMCAQEMEVPGSMRRVIRVMAHADLPFEGSPVRHVFLRGTQALRTDLADEL